LNQDSDPDGHDEGGIGIETHAENVALAFTPGLSYSEEESQDTVMRHVLSALVHNQPGVLAHVSGMLASRGFNIDSLAVGETEDANLSRMTFVVHGDDAELEQVRKQLDKIVTVVKVQDISSEDFVERDLMLIKVKTPPEKRMEIVLLVEMFRARVVDVSGNDMMIEISGQEQKIEAFIDLMRPYGILELARTGRIALVRGMRGGDVL
jgi:acetolactate synthase-1/3 small subunit